MRPGDLYMMDTYFVKAIVMYLSPNDFSSARVVAVVLDLIEFVPSFYIESGSIVNPLHDHLESLECCS